MIQSRKALNTFQDMHKVANEVVLPSLYALCQGKPKAGDRRLDKIPLSRSICSSSTTNIIEYAWPTVGCGREAGRGEEIPQQPRVQEEGGR